MRIDFDVPSTLEMQVRTLFQPAWAEPQHDIGHKGDELSGETKRELGGIAASAWGADTTLDRVQRGVPGQMLRARRERTGRSNVSQPQMNPYTVVR